MLVYENFEFTHRMGIGTLHIPNNERENNINFANVMEDT